MPPLAAVLIAFLGLTPSSPGPTAPPIAGVVGGQVGGLQVEYRSGQTFLTWEERPGADYRIYRAATRIRNANDLAQADLLGEVDDRTTWNRRRSLATGTTQHWIARPGAAPLADDVGLFVHTCANAGQAYYAVTAVVSGQENRTLVPGENSLTAPVFEDVAAPAPVLQSLDSDGALYAYWVSDRPTPILPALSIFPSQPYNVRFEPGWEPGPRGLLVRLHAAGQTYANGFPNRMEVPGDVDILAVDDFHLWSGWTFWFGSRADIPATPTPQSTISTHTLDRIKITLEWAKDALVTNLDPDRLYLAGGSMGGMGSIYMATAFPETFAAAFARNANYDLTANDLGNPSVITWMYGEPAWNLETPSGLGVYDRTNAAYMAYLEPDREWPILRTINGRNDGTTGWSSGVPFFEALEATARPAQHYFDLREHNPNGHWRALERELLRRTFAERRNRPTLRLVDFNLDDNAGNGHPQSGDPIGTIGGYADHDRGSIQVSPQRLEYTVFLRATGHLDDAPAGSGRARLVPRRTGAFAPAADDIVAFSWLRPGGSPLASYFLRAGPRGRLVTPRIELSRTPRRAVFSRQIPSVRPLALALGRPLAGAPLRLAVLGSPGASFALGVAVGGPPGSPGFEALVTEGGALDAAGRAFLSVETFSSPVWRGSELWITGRVGSESVPPYRVTLE